MIQKRLAKKETNLNKPYSYGPYYKFNNKELWVRISEGCVHNCPFCYEPTELKVFGVPEIIRNHVKIMDMNLLCKSQALGIIKELGTKKVNNKIVTYEMICGWDYRFLTQELANEIKKARFRNIRISWDWLYKDQFKLKKGLDMFIKAGFKPKEIMVLMICNWKIPFNENTKKLELLKVWGVKAGDCYFDGQVSPNINPEYWTAWEIEDFRRMVRKHNQLINFGVDPELGRP